MPPSPPSSRARMVTLVGALLVGALPLLYSAWLDHRDQARLDSPTPNPTCTARETATLSRSAAQFPYLPQDEAPTAFLVTAPELLPDFGIAHRGDAVLVYRQANLAALYDRQTENIINVISLPARGI